jgi:hypothetical protein
MRLAASKMRLLLPLKVIHCIKFSRLQKYVGFEVLPQQHNPILSTKLRYMEAAKLHHNNMNRRDVFCVSRSQKYLICSLGSPRGQAGPCALPSPGTHQLTTLVVRLTSPTSAPLSPTAYLRLTHLASLP